MDKIRALRRFIIKNFIISILIVAITEIAAILILNNLIFPGVSPLIFGEKTIVDYDIGTVLVFFLYSLVRGVFYFISKYFPIGLTKVDDWLIEHMPVFKGNVIIEHYENISLVVKNFMIAAIVVMIALLIAPIIVSGVVFTTRVIRRFSELEKEEAEKKALYEKKRNLMLSDIAHDLRTPITTIYGYSVAILDKKPDEAKTQEYLKLICMKSKKVDELINLLFDYVKMDSEGFTLHKEKCDLAEIVRAAGAFVYQDITDAGMELLPEIPEDEMIIEADKVQFSRVIINLLSNAIKHNPPGTKIGLFLKGNAQNPHIIVSDSGPVIDEKTASDIFEPFKTGDESRKSSGGSGLGLSIAKKITRLHGFNIYIKQAQDLDKDLKNEGFTKCFEIK